MLLKYLTGATDLALNFRATYVPIHCTEVKKGEINYSEIWLFQASLGYF